MAFEIFSGIEKATAGKAAYCKAGNHVLEVEKTSMQKNNKGVTSLMFTFKVVSSDSPEMAVGGPANYYTDTAHSLPLFLVNVRNVLAAVLGCAGDQITQEVVTSALDGDTALAGSKVAVTVEEKMNKKGSTFSVHTWSPYAGA